MNGVSVFIQTLNEEGNLPRCLDSVNWSDDVVVLDSLSTDRTEEIARSAGARFYQRPYDGRANNQNWAVENIEFKHPWVYYSDADEGVTPELAEEIQEIAADPARPEVLFRVRFKNMLMGTWIKRSSLYPTWVSRFFRPQFVRWERQANPVTIVNGPEGRLKHHFLHYNFSKGMSAWFHKHNLYSGFEAEETLKSLSAGQFDWKGILSPITVRRRKALKELSFRLPARPWAKFAYMYLLRGGFLDGRAGLTYCSLQAIYEYMITIKAKEMRLKAKGQEF